MIIEIRIPSPGESVTEVEIAKWLVSDGDYVEKDQEVAEVESDKATLPLLAEESGTITLKAEAGTAIKVGAVACTIDTEGAATGDAEAEGSAAESTTAKSGRKTPGKKEVAAGKKSPGKETSPAVISASKDEGEKPAGKDDGSEPAMKDESAKPPSHDNNGRKGPEPTEGRTDKAPSPADKFKISPLARKLMEKEGLTVDDVVKGLVRITKEDVELVAGRRDEKAGPGSIHLKKSVSPSRESDRQRMSMLRRKLSERLVAVKNETAMLTTFNEADMSNIIGIRKKYQSAFTEKHGVKLGFMSFFVKAATLALEAYPNVNSYIDGEDMVTPAYHDIGIAVQTDKGLMVPIVRNAGTMTLAEIEKEILVLADKARKNRISIDDMTGGTFTITNGGVFGSLLSTPILNPPQSGILGMHNIVERPVAIDGRVEIRPMMYIALSYDHRIIDGRDSVSFLVRVKEIIENPLMVLSGGSDPVDALLNI